MQPVEKTLPLLFLLLTYTIATSAQTINGRIYDAKTKVKNIKISNISKKHATYSDDEGFFSIIAEVGDSLTFSSLFYKEQNLVITENHLDDSIVIELKELTNALDEITLKSTPKEKGFEIVKYQANLGEQIKNDIKNNPHLYNKPPSGNLDIIQIIGLIGKLFKNKKKNDYIIKKASYGDLIVLFDNNAFFNTKLLINDFKIEEEHKYLFFEYCEVKQIDSKLLSKDNQVLLLDKLFTYSKEFLLLIENYKKEKSN